MEHGGQSAAKRFLTELDGLIPFPPPIPNSQKDSNRDRVHGGEILAQNRTEGGLCIIIRLPIR